MEFGWTDNQLALYEQTLRFAREQLNDSLCEREREREHRFGHQEWAACAKFGLLGLLAPERYGGRELDALTSARILEAVGRGCEDGGLVFSIAAHLVACVAPIAERGSEALKDAVLPGLCDGRLVGANAITEPQAGSDAFALRTRVVREGDTYILDGEKSYVTNGPIADLIVVYGMQNPSHGYLGITALVVETDRPGVCVGKPLHKLGLTTSPTSSVYFDGCRISARNRLGRDGQGARVFSNAMQWERTCLFAAYLGMAERQLETTIAHVKSRKQFGKPLAKHQVVAHRVVDMKLRLESARLLLYEACWLLATGQDVEMATALSKLAVSHASIQNNLDSVHLHGGLGIITETGVDRGLRDAIPTSIFSGSSEVQRDLIARGLGL